MRRIRTHRLLPFAIIAVVAAVLVITPLFSQGLDYVKEHYTKIESFIPMRDGTRLFTSIYLPKDTSQPYPILLNRTPYSVAPYGPDQYRTTVGPSDLFARDKYIFVYQDVRGRWMSEGEFVNMRPQLDAHPTPRDIDESTDTYDTIDWLIKNVPGHNGRVGQWGISYPGFYTAAGMLSGHPNLIAVSPQAPVTDWFSSDDFHHNGAFFLPHAFSFFASFGVPRPGPVSKSWWQPLDRGTEDGYEFYLRAGPLANFDATYFKGGVPFWNEMMAHETKDAYWQARNLRPHLKNVKPAVMTVGGWFDAENLFGALEVYKKVEANSPNTFNVLVMGPWVHGGWSGGDGETLGDVRFDSSTSVYYRENIELPFFDYYLKGRGDGKFPEAHVFETGRNQWHRLAKWPPAGTQQKTLYFRAGGRLAFDSPGADDANAFDEYVSDPAKPVPSIPGIATGMAQRYMVDDQRFAARRTDVVAYQTDVLEEDVTLAGPFTAALNVSTTGTDSDWVVKLIDVYPDRYPNSEGKTDNALGGYQQMVRGEIMRGKFRNSMEKPEPFVPGKPTLVQFEISDIFHTFRRGHRIMVQVQSSWFPLADRNPQKFVNVPTATAADFTKATQRVYRSKSLPSALKVGVVTATRP